MRQTVLVVLDDADTRQQALAALRAAPDLLPAAARSLKHALDVLDEMRVDLLLLDGAAASSDGDADRLADVAVVRLTGEPFEDSELVATVRAAIPPRTVRGVRRAN